MTRREKILAAGIAMLLALWGGSSAWTKYQIAVAARNSDLDTKRQALSDVQLEETRARIALEKLNAWRDRSLPTDRQTAQTLYRDWLLEQLNEAGLAASIDLNSNTPGTPAYGSVGYTVKAEGELSNLAEFLFSVYHTDQLHKISLLQVRPHAEEGKLDITLHMEALMIRGATLTDSLSDGTGERLALESADDYRASIAGRNVFAPYQPRQPVASRPVRDDSNKAFVTLIFFGDPKQLWISLDTGQVQRLHEGDRIRVPGFRGRLVEIRQKDAIVELREGRRLIRVGQSLGDAIELAEGEASASG